MAEERLNSSSHVYWIAAWRDGSLLMLPVVLIADAIFNDFWYPALKLFVSTHAHRGVFISFCCNVNISCWKWSATVVHNVMWKLKNAKIIIIKYHVHFRILIVITKWKCNALKCKQIPMKTWSNCLRASHTCSHRCLTWDGVFWTLLFVKKCPVIFCMAEGTAFGNHI